jgi:hypothetical protein
MAQQRRDPEQRPSPKALLEAARREDGRVGRFKIFVGAGTISAADRTDRSGAVLTIRLPIPATVDALETAA